MFKLGEIVELYKTGPTYPSFHMNNPFVGTYCKRYKPCNVILVYPKYSINSGYGTIWDLTLKKELQWKIRCIFYDYHKTLYIIGSNQNHMLICDERALRKIKI